MSVIAGHFVVGPICTSGIVGFGAAFLYIYYVCVLYIGIPTTAAPNYIVIVNGD